MKFFRKVTKTGAGTTYVALPRQFLEHLGWRKKQKVQVSQQKGAIVIRDAKTRKRV